MIQIQYQNLRFLIGIFFFISGSVSLVYQVTWVRMLSLFFGSDVYSAAITLSVFMGGLAIGSWLASRFVDHIERPILFYGICEVLIALSALAVPYVLSSLLPVYRDIYASFDFSPWLYHSFRIAAAIVTLLFPTIFMGATLPPLVRAFTRHMNELGQQAGSLYALNTLGALFGTFAAGFIMLPAFGVTLTVRIAAGTGLLVGIATILLGRNQRVPPAADTARETAPSQTPALMRTRTAVLLVMAVSGAAALALEIVWMRVLVQSFSATVYAFSIMLGCFLAGLYYGSAKVAAIIDKHENPLQFLFYLQLALGLCVALITVLSYIVPTVFGQLTWGLTIISGGAFGFASVIAQFVVASVLIIGPTMLLGAMFPCAVCAFTADFEHRAYGTGKIYAVNTAGAIIGALLGGFVLLPAAGTKGAMLIIALVFTLNSLALAFLQTTNLQQKFLRQPASLAMLGTGVVFAVIALILPPQTIVNYNLQRSTQPQVIYHGDGVSNTVDIVKNLRNETIMMINGTVEADTSFIQRRHFILKAHLPLLLHPNPKDIAVIGLGLGITVSATARYPTVDKIRLIELSPDMVAAHRFLVDITGNILHNSKLRLRIDDGRNFMAMSNEKFDMITADPVHPRITGVGYLYTKEYYQSIKSRLHANGVVTQWMPMYNISSKSFDVAFRTFAEVFPNSTFWYVRGHGLFVATEQPTRIDCRTLIENFNAPAIKEDFASIDIHSLEELLGYLLMGREQIAKYLARNNDNQINTDDNAYLEYRTPFEFMGRTDDIVPDLVQYAGWDTARLFSLNCSSEMLLAAHRLFEKRLKQIVPELKEQIQ